MSTDVQKKKAKRGKRGGKRAKERGLAEENRPLTAENGIAEETGEQEVSERPPIEIPTETSTTEGQLPGKKKTRRGRRGKAAVEAEATGVNAVGIGSGRTDAEQAAWENWESDKPSKPALQNQPFFGHLSPDEQMYFLTLEPRLDSPFETAEDQTLFVQAMYRELDGKELIVASSPECSMVLEKLLKLSDDFRLRIFFDRLNGRFGDLFRHQFGSHVIQALLGIAADVIERECQGESNVDLDEVDPELVKELPTMVDLVLALCEQGEGHWAEWMVDPYASHLVRTVLCVLAGKGEIDLRSKKSKKYNEEHNNVNLARTQGRPTTKPKKQRVVPESFGEMLRQISQDIVSSLSGPELRNYAQDPVANPVIQLLLSFPHASEPLITALLNIPDASTSTLSHDDFIESLIKSQVGSHLFEKLLATSPPHLFHQLYITYFRGKLQELSSWPLPVETTIRWSQDAVASHLLETLLITPTLNTKAKRKLIRGWLGSFAPMACNKYGSHVVDKCWAVADLALKEKMAEELVKSFDRLRNDHFGRFVARNCKLENFKRRREEWVERLAGVEKKKDMFGEFFDDADKQGKRVVASEQGPVDGTEGESKEVEDPLWTTHIFDEGMAALGFANRTAESLRKGTDDNVKKDKKKKKKVSSAVKDFENVEKMALDDEQDDVTMEETSTDVTKESRDEIENLFKKTKKRKRGEVVSDVVDDEAVENDEDQNIPVLKTVERDLAGVLDAISATKRKKSKSKKAGADEKGEKKKRKFEG
ncbi:uncharacterized protein SPPG_07093 [Spizellomyces punctatus DAOM BR117]|uniref:Nucleolar protein 9 n=1 Tax=Spizellomyces punctatus (strain DAOM BR117) TaxID=645134 RepID=A0A0L0H7Y5_SPIPD|nr:uncharacterized protein SPPG_07093 [Spizellomyces punctatus DAOM BR117]KNC97625.1 hypothetical protein SPPG_07093 [Spizellomyces punctatus DAOM BR117]|eukprot:XP_016605665.1 hypothetical protein SPPG_07093 [Spizellomyces punctatus DAOM BR117]